MFHRNGSPGTVAVTGGTQGIGAAIAQAFYDAGFSVVLGARHDNGLSRRLGSRAHFCFMDVRCESDHISLVNTACRETGRLDVFVNCAGISAWRAIHNVDEAFWSTMIDTNLKGALWGMKAAAARLPEGGTIINVSSLAGKRGSAQNAVYCAAKFGLNGLTQALAKELGARGIRVNAVCPVYVTTPGLMDALSGAQSPAREEDISTYLDDFAATQAALRRLPEAKEIADVCVFLASSAAGAITGQCINVDCGVLPQ